MMNEAKMNHAGQTASAGLHDTIQIMGDMFDAGQLSTVVEYLEEKGHRCAVFEGSEGIPAALANPRTKLLFFGGTEEELPGLLEMLRSVERRSIKIPTLFYLKHFVGVGDMGKRLQEIDDFLLEPLSLYDLHLRVKRLGQRMADMVDEVEQVKLSLTSHFGTRQFIGNAPAFLATIEKLPRVATCDAAVLLIGDTGTGKEMCARALHYLSPRAKKPFIPVNCGSIPHDLFESEMFGHEAGAFTDARQARKGLITEAEGGTLFLDEVDSLPHAAQVKLLRFLQDRQYRPLGSSRFRQADTRLIAATNKSLLDKVRAGTFREDLYYRLKVVALQLPTLREREEDILPLATHFLRTAAEEYGRPAARFSSGAIQKLMSHEWPGNVRELENVVRQAVVLANGDAIMTHDIHYSSDLPQTAETRKEPFKVAKARVIEAFERAYLKDLVAACDGNISWAAREAQKDRRAFFALLKKYNLTSAKQFNGLAMESGF